MIFSSETDKLFPALAKVKKELQAVSKSANNPFFKSKYADLNTYLDEVEPRLEKEGLMLLQPCSVDSSGNNLVHSIIVHVESGQRVVSSMKLVGDAKMQDAGGGVTYARRYTLGAVLSMKAEDDDGNKVSGKTEKKESKSSSSKAASGTTKSSSAKSSKAKSSGFRNRTKAKPQASGGDDW